MEMGVNCSFPVLKGGISLEIRRIKRGLDGFSLKLIALILMTIDHVGYFFASFGAPVWLRWIGRLAAPVFLFLLAEGFAHTKSREKYLLRMYLAGVGMAAMSLVLNRSFIRADGMILRCNIFFSLFWVLLLLTVFTRVRACFREGKRAFACAILFAAAGFFLLARLLRVLPVSAFWTEAANVLLPDLFSVEGGAEFVFTGVLLYVLRQYPLLQAGAYVLLCVYRMPFGCGAEAFFLTDYGWMAMASVVLWLLYDGRRGFSAKLLFYGYYPIHIGVLFVLPCLIG